MLNADRNNPRTYDRTISRAIEHLPRRPVQVAVIDANETKPGVVREMLLKLDAFTLRQDAITDRSNAVYW